MIRLLACLSCCVVTPGAFAGPTSAPVDRPIVLAPTVYPDGVSDESAYTAWLNVETERLAAGADAATSDPERIEANLGLANWLLAVRIEPAATRIVLGLEAGDDRETVRTVTEAAIERLAKAGELISAYQPSDPAAADDTDEAWEETRATLEVFARGLASLGRSGDDAASQQRKAAVSFALYVDDSRRQVALYARLWQAVLLLESNDADRAARSLKPTLEPMADPLPEFFLRVLRVRAALRAAPESDAGRYVTAIALLLRLEERCEQTFSSTETARLAEQTCATLRSRLAAEWKKSLETAGQSSAASAVAELGANDVSEAEDHAGGPIQIIRLQRAIPILIAAGGAPRDTQFVEPRPDDADDAPAEDEMDDHSDELDDEAGADDDEGEPPPEM